MTEREIFLAALKQPSAGERAAFLDQACGSDANLRGHIEALLAEHEQLGSYLESPVAAGQRTVDEPPITERPGAVIGPYKLLQQIGEGGMGVVWMAEQTQPVQRKVALKVIKPGMDSRQVIARFEAERQALALMDHVNIARVFDGGATETGRPYFVMELVHGVPITKYCDDNHLTPRQRLELFVPVCQAIQHAHQKGIIHRDVKPSNVMITLYDGKPVPKVIDFGVAKATEQKLTERTLFTQYGAMVGTLEYMSPEQAEMSALGVDTRSDIYSLGVLLYELLTGTTPLTHKRMKEAAYAEILRLIKEEEPPRPSTRLSDSGEALASISVQRHTEPAKLTKLMRGELDWIVMKTLEKDRNRRYETAKDFAADVQRYLGDEPVLACPPSRWYRFRKFARRNKRPVLAVAVVLLALVGGVIGTTWGMMRAEQARSLAENESDEKDKARQLAETREREALRARDAERSALAGEVKQRQRAETNAKLATAVLEEIILKEARQRLTLYTQDQAKGVIKSPEREKLEWEFLEKGLKFYEQLAQTNATDWTARRERAKAYANVGLVRLELKQYGESEKAFRQAVQLAEALATERPQDFDARYDLAYNYHWLYRPCYDSSQFAAAEKATSQALVLFEKLAVDFPDRSPFVQETIAYIHGNVGRALDASGRPEEAAKAFRHSVVLYEKLAAEFPDRSPLYQEHKASAHRNLAQVLGKSGKPQEAEQAFQKSIAIWSELATAHPKAASYREALAWDHGLLGDLFRQTGQMSQAMDAWRKTVPILEKVVAETNNPQIRWQMAGWQERLGRALAETGQPQEAEKVYRKALSVWKKLVAETNAPDNRWHLAQAHEQFGYQVFKKTGRPREAVSAYRDAMPLWENLVAEHPQNADYRLHLSWNYGFLSECLLELGEHSEAAKIAVKLASAFLPDDWQGYHRAALLLARCVPLAEKDVKLPEADRKVVAQAYLDQSKELMRQAAERIVDNPEIQNNFAWQIVASPAPHPHAVKLAVGLAQRAVARAPDGKHIWNTLGVAQYRAGDWKVAIETLKKAEVMYGGGQFSANAFFIAMAHWQLGEKEQARKWYAPTLVWMEKHAPKNEELIRFRAEAASLLGLPEALTPEQELAKADDVKFYALVLEAHPEAAWAYGARGSTYAERGQWKEAAAEFARAAELNSGYPFHQYRQALVRLQRGDVAGYRKLCADMLVRFAPAAKADSAHWVVWTCVLAADAVADWKIPRQLAEKTVADNPKNYRALHQLGAVLYRASQYQEALKRLTEAEAVYRADDAKLSAIAYNWLFLAMAHHRLGQVEEAQKWRDKATQWIDKEMQKKPKEPAAANPLPWNRRLTLQLLRREAEKRLK